MLQSLRVRNLAIVEDIRVEFEKGLNVITGETGAGKSILVGALGLLLGERADRTMIRAGEETCAVEAEFHLADSGPVDAILDELGLAACEDGRLIVRRVITAAGGGKNLVNDGAATLQALKRVGDVLVDMHGPHDHQSLLSPASQLDILDSFGHLWKERAEYEEAWRSLQDLDGQRRALDADDQSVAQQIEMLSFQVKEIDDAGLEGTVEEEILAEHTRIANAGRILEHAGAAQNLLSEDEASAFQQIVNVQAALRSLRDLIPESAAWLQEAEAIAVQIQELARSIADSASRIEGDPGRLQWLDDRLALLHRLKRKYGTSVAEIVAFRDKAKTRLDELESRGERIAALEVRLAEARKLVDTRGRRLGKNRRAAAESLAKAVTKELRDLGFPHSAFSVALEAGEPQLSGLDRVDFGFAPNAGEPMRPLRTIASSGEISRVMLATKAVLAQHDRIPLLVFDEIDSNVGGEMGNAIGEKLGKVARTHQVLCITHLPQVAVHGTTHLVVTKSVKDGRTRTDIRLAANDARAEEIARMLGGRDLTSVTLRHAREMLKNRGA